MKIGDKVVYTDKSSNDGFYKIGFVKSINEDADTAFVVFNWSDEPHNYMNYTASLCKISNLELYK
jgi:hypothetical protein